MSRFSQARDLALHSFAGTLSAAVACLTVACHRVLVECEPDPECFGLAKEFLLSKRRKAALDDGTDASLSGERAEVAKLPACLLLETALSNVLFFPPDGLSL